MQAIPVGSGSEMTGPLSYAENMILQLDGIEGQHRALLVQGQVAAVQGEDGAPGLLQNDPRGVVIPR